MRSDAWGLSEEHVRADCQIVGSFASVCMSATIVTCDLMPHSNNNECFDFVSLAS